MESNLVGIVFIWWSWWYIVMTKNEVQLAAGSFEIAKKKKAVFDVG